MQTGGGLAPGVPGRQRADHGGRRHRLTDPDLGDYRLVAGA
ncbi:hypothetical protein Z029_15410 [Mycobacterium tuberculosis INS_SEN]|nr:hypothetical protein M943_14920 [Mycobacterium tuberculosis EAI5]ESK71169.1 hypothetical protein O217_15330 [Mycobacterium tuberculosis variant bovis AN5]ESK74780.1 hypothetical protein O216_15640 [Mycobacterium tuberculosis variant bovis 04-303]EUA98240.1 hypothetical protein Z030_15440 [Mycobacterium tuberculosis INS_XDR]EUA99915.1 hypothetical protein Z029_15410 [Mycobacterium tuberculosis INS_SEN]EUB05065.1 hypothetical protein Z028_15450 [Mycobacterium tuberculosis INS_MDR]KDA15228.1 